jgi:hypothetical protein
MDNTIVEVRGGHIVEIYSQHQRTAITVVDWDEAQPGQSDPPYVYPFPTISFSRLPVETRAAYHETPDASDDCAIVDKDAAL